MKKAKWEDEGVMDPPTDQELSDIETEEEWDEQFGEPDSKTITLTHSQTQHSKYTLLSRDCQ